VDSAAIFGGMSIAPSRSAFKRACPALLEDLRFGFGLEFGFGLSFGLLSTDRAIHEMKKFLVFTFYVGRPLGGAQDFLDSFDSIEEALDNILNERTRYYQIVDRDTMRIVKQGLSRFKNFAPENFRNGESA
jgi:hypothetical protein